MYCRIGFQFLSDVSLYQQTFTNAGVQRIQRPLLLSVLRAFNLCTIPKHFSSVQWLFFEEKEGEKIASSNGLQLSPLQLGFVSNSYLENLCIFGCKFHCFLKLPSNLLPYPGVQNTSAYFSFIRRQVLFSEERSGQGLD